MTWDRDTGPATIAAAKVAKQKRLLVIEEIRREVFEQRCTCAERDRRENRTMHTICKDGNYDNLCISYRGIARILNDKKIVSPQGKIGTWQATMVINLFKNPYDSLI